MIRQATFVSLTALSACASWQPAPTPALDTGPSPGWTEYLSAESSSDNAQSPPFWRTTTDEKLAALVARIDQSNPDLSLARARVSEARAIQRAEIASIGPTISADASVTAQRISETGSLPAGRIPGFETEQVLYEAGFDARWEIDIFGRNAAQRGLSDANVAIAEQRLEGARFLLEAELARSYVRCIGAGMELDALKRVIRRQELIVSGIRTRRNHGEASDLDVERAQAQLDEHISRQPPLEEEVAVSSYRLAVLSGQAPGAFDIVLPATLPHLAPVSFNLNSAVLRQRSDVREAELAYVRAARETDLATLDLYPRFFLFGGGGPSTTEISDFLDPASLSLNLGAMANWALFDGGRQDAKADAARARLVASQASYRSTVLNAMEEIESAGVNYLKAAEQLKQREAITRSRGRIASMARARFEGGTGTVLETLETERDLAEAELADARARTDWIIARIAFDKALGVPMPLRH